MGRLRSLTFPKFYDTRTQQQHSDNMPSCNDSFGPTRHYCDSSDSSGVSSPVTPTSSHRSHNRCPSSNSSIMTTPDSPTLVTRSPLHDLVEVPSELENLSLDERNDLADEPLCICDTAFCEHRKNSMSSTAPSAFLPSPTVSEWMSADVSFNDNDSMSATSIKRRTSVERPRDSAIVRHFPLVSRRWRDHGAKVSLSSPSVRSAPSSRASSTSLASAKHSLSTHLGRRANDRLPITPSPSLTSLSQSEHLYRRTSRKEPPPPLDISASGPEDEPVDRQALSSTPLLPPAMTELREQTPGSPLQSPSVAAPSRTASIANLPLSSPVPTCASGMPTPPLSAKASFSSISLARSNYRHASTSELSSRGFPEETDPWAIKLGHANFHILPEPYLPETCDLRSCNRLLEDWETARLEYMRQAAQVREHHGPTSHTYKLTEQKWAEIDAQWRVNLERANAEATACGESPATQSLAATQPLGSLPALSDPRHPEKFPSIDDADVVGPMVRYVKVERSQAARRPRGNLLRIFTDPKSLLGSRSVMAFGR